MPRTSQNSVRKLSSSNFWNYYLWNFQTEQKNSQVNCSYNYKTPEDQKNRQNRKKDCPWIERKTPFLSSTEVAKVVNVQLAASTIQEILDRRGLRWRIAAKNPKLPRKTAQTDLFGRKPYFLGKWVCNLGKLASSVVRHQNHQKFMIQFIESCPKKTAWNFGGTGEVCERGNPRKPRGTHQKTLY